MSNRLNTSGMQLAYLLETIENAIPVTPPFKLARVTGETLEAARTFAQSNEINGTRNVVDSQIASADAKGSVDFELTYGSHDDFISNALWNGWVANVIKNGVTPRPLSLEVLYNGAVNADAVYKRFSGCYINTLDMTIKMGEAIKCKADILGRTSSYDIAPITGATYEAPNTNPMMMGSDFGQLVIGGLTIDCISMLSMKISNVLRAQRCLGTIHPTGVGNGDCEVTGAGEMYLTAAQYGFIQSYLSAADVAMAWRLGTVATKRYDFSVGRVRIENLKTEAAGQNNDVLIKFDWRGLGDNAVGNQKTLQITRAV